ncbi:hypothetical protein [Hespellia stercorisuis]|uniref:Uncharacterized protein n=1 Tax=Hespellia stercorisuis DSM 15480 TaxID=1121950 RepID=A0A1M6VGP4_9FIRM|nr:hypothetical protein [Hespellia stercorisuis]SHK80640.1 hypothetical protein SAMN02745243_03766 [Hespellia stercorisuis DSM 15480]
MAEMYMKVEFDEDEVLKKIKEIEDATAMLKVKVNELSSFISVKASPSCEDDAEDQEMLSR